MLRRATALLSSSGTATASSADIPKPRPSVANHVPMRRNKIATKVAEFYMTKIPTGFREFSLMGPLCLIAFAVVFNMEYFLPESMSSRMTGGYSDEKKDMMTYRLEPLYDDKGKLYAYRRISTQRIKDPDESH